jgi:hypothetical protein
MIKDLETALVVSKDVRNIVARLMSREGEDAWLGGCGRLGVDSKAFISPASSQYGSMPIPNVSSNIFHLYFRIALLYVGAGGETRQKHQLAFDSNQWGILKLTFNDSRSVQHSTVSESTFNI